jgi:SAM-dependent methyltransferase
MSNSLQSSIATLQHHWDVMAREQSDDLAKVDTSARSQWFRFIMFSRFNDLAGASVLDVGCGVGDFWTHLLDVAPDIRYTGLDLSPAMVERCRERFPDTRFEAVNLLEWQTDERWDYVTAIAIHNVVMENGWEILEAMTRRQFDLCNVATHLSLLTTQFEGYAPHIQPWDPARLLALAFSLTPYVSLRHDYLPHDFSITLYREPLADRIRRKQAAGGSHG